MSTSRSSIPVPLPTALPAPVAAHAAGVRPTKARRAPCSRSGAPRSVLGRARALPRQLVQGVPAVRHPGGEVARDRERELEARGGLLDRLLVEVALRDLEDLAWGRGDRGHEPHALREQPELAEVLAGPEHRELALALPGALRDADGSGLHD